MKTAIVTGAGSGIGKAVAIALSKEYHVGLFGRRLEPLEVTAELCEKQAMIIQADVSHEPEVRAGFDKIFEKWGRLDVLFNNAGTGLPGTTLFEDIQAEQWQNVVDVNLSGMFYCMQNAFRLMKQQSPKGGRIINNGSISAQVPRPNSAAYSATKHAVTGLTRTASLDGREHDIAVGQIDIGNAITEFTAKISQGMPQADGSIKAEAMMDVQHVAEAVKFMTSLPLSANVFSMTLMATKMPFAGRG